MIDRVNDGEPGADQWQLPGIEAPLTGTEALAGVATGRR